MGKRINLSIVLVTFNSQNTINNCVNSIGLKSQITDGIIIVDNASKDKTIEILKRRFPGRIKLIKYRKNLGFAKAANQGAKIAKGEYLLFLNPDTVVKSNCIESMLEFAKNKKDAAIVGCKVLNPDGSLQPSSGRFPTISNIIFDRMPIINKIIQTEQIRLKDYYKKVQKPDWVTGAFFLAKREVFEKLGGFDERYFLYVEDVDFCYRVKKAGYKIYYNPNAEIIHYDQGKSPQRKNFKAKQMRKGFTIYFEKYKPNWYMNIWRMILAFEKLFKPTLR